MRLLGWELTRTRTARETPVMSSADAEKSYPYSGTSVVGDRGWWPLIKEPFTGAWQRGMSQRPDALATYHAIYACVTLITQDVSKLRCRLVEQSAAGIWSEVLSQNPFSPVLRRPNHYQNRIKFFEQWVISKLLHGNCYALKERDGRGIVTQLYILDPCRTRALVADDGSVYYSIGADNLTGIKDAITVPASEIIHDVMIPLFHPLCGVSPITACGLAATQGLSIQRNSAAFFANGSNPGGILTAPGRINDDTAKRIKEHWEENYTGLNSGRTAVLGDGLKYERLSVNAVDAQLIEQLKWSTETVCSCFHVPMHKIGIGQLPNYNNIEALDQQYYSQCIQAFLENIELCLDEGLGLANVPGHTYGTEFDLDDLLRMDTLGKVEAAAKAVGAAIMKPDEARRKFDLPPTEGGDACYLQEQNYSLAALAKRDALADPFGKVAPPAPAVAAPPPAAPTPNANDNGAAKAAISRRWEKAYADVGR